MQRVCKISYFFRCEFKLFAKDSSKCLNFMSWEELKLKRSFVSAEKISLKKTLVKGVYRSRDLEYFLKYLTDWFQ